VKVDVSCHVCGQQARIDVGTPSAGQTLEEHLHFVQERLSHRPSFECFGGHTELRAPLPACWTIHWNTLADE